MRNLIVLLFCLLLGMNAYASELGAADRQIIEAAGIQVYPGAIFVNGSKAVGYRFASNKSSAIVRAWYSQQLSTWSLYEEFGGWILYDGDPGLGMGEVMAEMQVMVKANAMLPDWFGVDKELTTEIIIMIP